MSPEIELGVSVTAASEGAFLISPRKQSQDLCIVGDEDDEIPMLSDDCNMELKKALDAELGSSTDHDKPEIRSDIWRQAHVLLLGQLLSLCLAIYSFISSYISEMGLDMPFTQSMAIYLPLAVFYGGALLHRRQKLQIPWYYYVILAAFDVHGNFLSIQSYQYTSITSVTLLLCWTIPWVIILTWFVLRTRYYLWQLVGAAICVAGLVLAVLSDGMSSGDGGRNPLLGDVLVIAGTICFALSNVGMEFCVKKKDLVEALAMLGVFGVLIDLCELSIFEKKNLASVKWTPTLIALFAAFGVAQFLCTNMAAYVLKMSGATLLNLSILTSNLWAALIRVFFYKKQVNGVYCIAFAFSSIGLIIYSLNDATSTTEATKDDLEASIPYQALTEENSTCGAEVSVDLK